MGSSRGAAGFAVALAGFAAGTLGSELGDFDVRDDGRLLKETSQRDHRNRLRG